MTHATTDPRPLDPLGELLDAFEEAFAGGLDQDDAHTDDLDARLEAARAAIVAHVAAEREAARREAQEQPPPELLEKWMQNELSDYRMVLDHCTRIYSHFSRGRISKPNTLPEEVIAVAEEFDQHDIEEAVREALDDKRAGSSGVPPSVFVTHAWVKPELRCPEAPMHRWDGDGCCKACGKYATDMIDAALLASGASAGGGAEVRT